MLFLFAKLIPSFAECQEGAKMSLKELAAKFFELTRPETYHLSILEFVETEDRKFAFFITQEIIDGLGLGYRSPRGIQLRYTLYRITQGQKEPEVIFEDHAWSGSSEQEGRSCCLDRLVFEDKTVRVVHDTTPYEGKKRTEIRSFPIF